MKKTLLVAALIASFGASAGPSGGPGFNGSQCSLPQSGTDSLTPLIRDGECKSVVVFHNPGVNGQLYTGYCRCAGVPVPQEVKDLIVAEIGGEDVTIDYNTDRQACRMLVEESTDTAATTTDWTGRIWFNAKGRLVTELTCRDATL